MKHILLLDSLRITGKLSEFMHITLNSLCCNVLLSYYGCQIVCHCKGRTQIEGIWEQGTEKNICTYVRESNGMEKIT